MLNCCAHIKCKIHFCNIPKKYKHILFINEYVYYFMVTYCFTFILHCVHLDLISRYANFMRVFCIYFKNNIIPL